MSANGPRVGVDVGGTFTDLVALAGDEIVTAKVPSTPADQSEGVERSLEAAGVEAWSALAHGMTVATNALLERRGARTALVTTAGFRDLLEIGRQNRAGLYDLPGPVPDPLVPCELRFTVAERMGPDGELEPLDEDSLRSAVEAVRAADVEAVAVCLLFGFLHPSHEQAVGRALRSALPEVHVSLSSEVLPQVREFERCATTTADAYLAPRLGAYLGRLGERLRRPGAPEPLVMQSSGGVTGLGDAARRAAGCVLSGPAGGVVGAAHVAAASGFPDVLSFDMGGTSTDVAPILGGEAATTTESVVAGVPVKLPAVDVHTVSAGGGSIAWADPGGALRVGPRSAGADPGPAAYGRGGEDPTVTDANLLLGRLEDGLELGGELTLDRSRAERALAGVGEPLGLDAVETALGAVSVANAEMARALRTISVARGLDPREFALVAFGGAGAMHACALAEELEMKTVLVPRAGGVLSALGLALADTRRDYEHPLPGLLGELDPGRLEDAFGELEQAARADLDSPELRRAADLRYRGQSFELTVAAGDPERLAARFGTEHERRYGYRMEDEPIEVVSVRLRATVAVDPAEPAGGPAPAAGDSPERPAGGGAPSGERRVNFDGDWRAARVWNRAELGHGSTLSGPAVVEFPESTCVLAPGWDGELDASGTLVLVRAS